MTTEFSQARSCREKKKNSGPYRISLLNLDFPGCLSGISKLYFFNTDSQQIPYPYVYLDARYGTILPACHKVWKPNPKVFCLHQEKMYENLVIDKTKACTSKESGMTKHPSSQKMMSNIAHGK